MRSFTWVGVAGHYIKCVLLVCWSCCSEHELLSLQTGSTYIGPGNRKREDAIHCNIGAGRDGGRNVFVMKMKRHCLFSEGSSESGDWQ